MKQAILASLALLSFALSPSDALALDCSLPDNKSRPECRSRIDYFTTALGVGRWDAAPGSVYSDGQSISIYPDVLESQWGFGVGLKHSIGTRARTHVLVGATTGSEPVISATVEGASGDAQSAMAALGLERDQYRTRASASVGVRNHTLQQILLTAARVSDRRGQASGYDLGLDVVMLDAEELRLAFGYKAPLGMENSATGEKQKGSGKSLSAQLDVNARITKSVGVIAGLAATTQKYDLEQAETGNVRQVRDKFYQLRLGVRVGR